MPDIETNKDKNLDIEKTHSTSTEAPKESNKEKPKDSKASTAPKKSVWDLPDGEYSEVFDSEGHRNRINHY